MTFEAFLSDGAIRELQASEQQKTTAQKRTPEQIEAIYTHGRNVLVSASAGSGKTFVMVERILDKLKRGIQIEELFISTFTVKAAGELKERIEKKITEAITTSKTEEMRRHLSHQLANLENADIGTMDSFTQKFVMTYGYEIGIAPNFRILMDTNEQELLKNEVFADLFSDYLSGEDRVIFERLVRNFSGNHKDYKQFRAMVYQIYAFSQATSSPEKWLKNNLLKGYDRYTAVKDLPKSFITGLLSSLYQTANDLEDLTYFPDYKQKTAKGVDTAIYKKHKTIYTELRNKAALTEQSMDMERLPSLIEEISQLVPSGTDITVSGTKYPIFKTLHSRLKQLKFLDTVVAYQHQAQPLLAVLQQFMLDFSSQYLQVKIQENAFEFSDISHFAIRILEENEQIRQFFQDKYHEIMVDEYQDNNHTQERMLNLLSTGKNRFMVGDIKQSIYRFRQADPTIFQEKFEIYQSNPLEGKLILLKENFRSQTEVLDATNAVFTRLMDKEVGQIKYDHTHCLVAGSERQKIEQPQNKMEYLLYNTDEENEEIDFTTGEIELVVKEIIALHNEKGVPFSDITLLVPSRTRNGDILSCFEKHGIPLVADGGEVSYLTSLEVMVMLDTLRTINNPLNDYALVALLKSPMFSFDEDELTRLALQADTGFFYDKLVMAIEGTAKQPSLISSALKKKLLHFEETFTRWRQYSKRHSLHDLIWRIFNDRLYYDYVGALPNGRKRQANLYALTLRANQFEKTGFKGLSRFISMIDKLLASNHDLADVPVSVPKDAVQLMTIHKSKGLEFKYVFVLNMDKQFNAIESRSNFILNRENGIGIQLLIDMKEHFDTPLPHVRVSMNTLPYHINQQELKIANLSEQMRLLYVAMTRAEIKLYLVGKGSKDKLSSRYDGRSEAGVLARDSRELMTSFQDWVLAIDAAFGKEDLPFDVHFVEDTDLTSEKIGTVKLESKLGHTPLKDIRQSDDIADALKQVESVQVLNDTYKAAIDLPSLRTPSQLKKIYEPLLEEQALDIIEKNPPKHQFTLPNLSKNKEVTGAQVGTAVHEVMQALDLSWIVTEESVRLTLQTLQLEEKVKKKINVQSIVNFFDTDLGREILNNTDKLYREAPFSCLRVDPISKEEFVLRGIIDGYLLYDDRIVLFDYKTDRYDNPQELALRYNYQMELYADTLRQAYDIVNVETYLILLGGQEIDILRLT